MTSSAFARRRPLQIPLPLSSPERFSRDDLIVCPGNAQAIAYVDSWPGWPVPVVVLHGPRGCGKTHLASLWRDAANAVSIDAARVAEETLPRLGAVIVEDVDSAGVSPARDAALFGLLGRTKADAPLLLTGRTHPATWPVLIPDLASRFAAIPALALWAPDEALLAALARKLFCDRQLYVPDTVIDEMLRRLDRSPGAIRDFVADLDAAALAAAKPINLALVRSFIAARADTL